jgi:hypothetical protein
MERLGDLTKAIRNAPPGRMAGRFFKAMAVAKGNLALAAKYAEQQRFVESRIFADNVKAGVAAHGTENSLYYPIAQDIAALAAKISAMRRLPGFRGIRTT